MHTLGSVPQLMHQDPSLLYYFFLIYLYIWVKLPGSQKFYLEIDLIKMLIFEPVQLLILNLFIVFATVEPYAYNFKLYIYSYVRNGNVCMCFNVCIRVFIFVVFKSVILIFFCIQNHVVPKN